MNSTHPHKLAGTAISNLEALYLADGRPWVIAYSGGKDSTATLQLVFEMLLKLGPDAHKPVFVLSSDTQVEAPNVAAYISASLEKIQAAAESLKLPLSTRLVSLPQKKAFGES